MSRFAVSRPHRGHRALAFFAAMLAVDGAAFLLLDLVGGRTAHAADASYALRLEVPPAKRGQKGVARIHIAPGAGFHMNRDYPMVVSVVAPAGLAIERPKQTAKDAVKLEEAGVDFDVAYTASEAGAKLVTGELKFAVCNASSCDPKKEKLSFTIDVK
jgi:hypothetical protein